MPIFKFEPNLYEQFLQGLQKNQKTRDIITDINSALAQRIKTFQLHPESKNLLLPRNYASIPPVILKL